MRSSELIYRSQVSCALSKPLIFCVWSHVTKGPLRNTRADDEDFPIVDLSVCDDFVILLSVAHLLITHLPPPLHPSRDAARDAATSCLRHVSTLNPNHSIGIHSAVSMSELQRWWSIATRFFATRSLCEQAS